MADIAYISGGRPFCIAASRGVVRALKHAVKHAARTRGRVSLPADARVQVADDGPTPTHEATARAIVDGLAALLNK